MATRSRGAGPCSSCSRSGAAPCAAILLAEEQDPSPQLDRIEELAARLRVPVETVPRARLDAQARTEAPQGVLALARPLEPVALEDLCAPDRRGTRAVPPGGGRHHRSPEPGGAPAQRRVRRRDRRRPAAPPLGPPLAHGDQDGGRGDRAPALRGGRRRAGRAQRAARARRVVDRPGRRGRAVALRAAAGRGPGRARWSGARKRGWRRWCAGAAMRWWPFPSTARCRRSTSAWPARSPASRWPASAAVTPTARPARPPPAPRTCRTRTGVPRRGCRSGTPGTRASRAWAPPWAAG